MTQSPTSDAGRGPADRARLAHALRAARRRRGLGGVEAGTHAGMSQSKISKIERGLLLPSADDVGALCRVYEVGAEQRDELLALVRGLREEASARVIMSRGVAGFQRRVERLEAAASLVRGFQPTMVPGLVQTPAYARCVFGSPAGASLSPEEVDAAVAARGDRREAVGDGPTRFRLVLTEGALRWHAGSPAIMADQVQAIADAASLENLDVGLIPWTTPVGLFPRHGFHLYDEDAVIVGTETATATLTGDADIATYVELFRGLEEIASFGAAAHTHLGRIADEYRRLAGG
ncbi:helix-turn-helix protein [Murinocardiopsis flavida]|uniref:Helix-turn-helix protein n=1 Tax=Murinocardiopsis flavida TaxID=645275 RepID=A0A2P8DGL5_9ACTN|nr:helix-turn-helix transcriptional regulator [Murinocardiopsis flavida]PSK96329.1 helix-turn-helix protein [Murinocardiopsis flavida]